MYLLIYLTQFYLITDWKAAELKNSSYTLSAAYAKMKPNISAFSLEE